MEHNHLCRNSVVQICTGDLCDQSYTYPESLLHLFVITATKMLHMSNVTCTTDAD